MLSSRFRFLPAAVVAACAMAATAVQADTIVSSVPVWNGSDSTGITFGTPTTVTMGETFTNSPGYGALTSFAFYVKNNTFNAFQITTSVYAWTGSTTTGSALFTSAPITVAANNVAPGYQLLTTSTGNVPLVAGGKYIALASINGGSLGLNASWAQAFGAGSSFFGGQYVYTNTAISPGSAWTVANSVSAFTMAFAPAAPVPEPSTLSFAAVGALLIVGRRFSRRRHPLAAANRALAQQQG